MKKRAVIACERSGKTRNALTEKGWFVISVDLLPATDFARGHGVAPNGSYHYQGEILDFLYNDPIGLMEPGCDMLIAHPDCTYLTNSAEWAYKDVQTKKMKSTTLIGAARRQARDEAIKFVDALWNAPVEKIAIENPVGVLSSRWREPDQFIQPYEYGEDASKKTCLWLKNLPLLNRQNCTPPVSHYKRTEKVILFDGETRQTAGKTNLRRPTIAGRNAPKPIRDGQTLLQNNGVNYEFITIY
jgi:hypothetical protein